MSTQPDTDVRGFLKALASTTRQDIMFQFDSGAELTVTEVAGRLNLAQSATSTHLATLRDAGILTSRREWKTVYYRANPTGILTNLDNLRDYLLACCPPDCTTKGNTTKGTGTLARTADLRRQVGFKAGVAEHSTEPRP